MNIPMHADNIRTPMLQAGVRYALKTWLKTPVYSEVTFKGWSRAGQDMDKEKLPMMNRATSLDVLHFESEGGSAFSAQVVDCVLVLPGGVRLTFFKTEQHVTPVPGPVLLLTGPESPAECAPVEDKAAAKRARDAQRKRDARARAKLAQQG